MIFSSIRDRNNKTVRFKRPRTTDWDFAVHKFTSGHNNSGKIQLILKTTTNKNTQWCIHKHTYNKKKEKEKKKNNGAYTNIHTTKKKEKKKKNNCAYTNIHTTKITKQRNQSNH